MTWRNGRQLASYSLGGKTYRYEYDVNGLRTRKSNADGGSTEYYIIDGLAVAERRYYSGGGVQYTLRYLYDESNNPVGFGMQYPNSTGWTNYYFEKNVQGDVIGVYQKEGDGNSATHILAARYSYDPYGNPTSMTNGAGTAVSQTSNTIAAINPFRYRGYRYDGDTGLYYLRSRYYDPVSCRFVNADCSVGTGQGITGYNMFSYGLNDPINRVDANGQDSIWYYLKQTHTMGSIHRFVQIEIKAKFENSIEIEAYIEKNGKRDSRADIVSNEGKVWEIKHGSKKGGILRIAEAQFQASKYIGGKVVRNDVIITGFGEAGAFDGEFTINCLNSTYLVTYTTPAEGAVLYSVKKIGKQDKTDYTIYIPNFKKNNDEEKGQETVQGQLQAKAPGPGNVAATVIGVGVGIGMLAGGGGSMLRPALRASYVY